MFRFDVGDDESDTVPTPTDTNTVNFGATGPAEEQQRPRFVEIDVCSHIQETKADETSYDLVNVSDGKLQLKKTPWKLSQFHSDSFPGCTKNPSTTVKRTCPPSEVVQGVYEGGGKLWECAVDLLAYLHDKTIDFQDKTVLELGAGHALPSVYALVHEAAGVVVQDLNASVLKEITCRNFVLNISSDSNGCTEKDLEKVKYVAGNWKGVVELFEKELAKDPQFDIILSTETTYREQDLEPLADAIVNLLKRNTGVAYVAGKSYYFGTGGGLRAFEESLRRRGEVSKVQLEIECAEEIRDGMSNVREILKIGVKDL